MSTHPERLTTIEEAKTYIAANAPKKGCSCPACGQYVKHYKRRLNANAAKALILIYNISMSRPDLFSPEEENKYGFIHIQNEFSKQFKLRATGMDYIQLPRWGLIEKKPEDKVSATKKEDRYKPKHSGFWRITPKGVNFALKRSTLPEYCIVFDNRTIGWGEKQINIEQALGKKFSYQEVINLRLK